MFPYFALRTDTFEPIYAQIAGSIERQIYSGRLPSGSKLPSVREIASSYTINPMTVSKAFKLLVSKHLIEEMRGKGMVVVGSTMDLNNRLDQLLPYVYATVSRSHDLNITADHLNFLIDSQFRELQTKGSPK